MAVETIERTVGISNHSEPQVQAPAVERTYLLVDELLTATGVTDRRSVTVDPKSVAHATDQAADVLRPFVEMAIEAASVLSEPIKNGSVKADAKEMSERILFPLGDNDRQRHAGYAARVLTNAGLGVNIRHEVRTGPFRSEKVVRTKHPEQFQTVLDMMPGVEVGISERLGGIVSDEQARRRVASGLMGIAAGSEPAKR